MTLYLRNLCDLIKEAAAHPSRTGLILYESIGKDDGPTRLTYQDLLVLAEFRSNQLKHKFSLEDGSVVLLHFDNHSDGIIWFWAVVLAGLVPCISPPFTKDIEQRRKHILHLQALLQGPLIITTDKLYPEFLNINGLDIHTTKEVLMINSPHSTDKEDYAGSLKQERDLAVLMLTSGSTGNAKAVELRHGQIMHAIKGKSAFHRLETETFLNWVGLDHVANLTEVHLQAMGLGADQVHVPKEIASEPPLFLQLIENHRVSYTFAPNFFLANIVRSLGDPQVSTNGRLSNAQSSVPSLESETKHDFDLTSLRVLVSGGESNVVDTCDTLTRQLQKYGAPTGFICPGFGMTETCAGSVYSKDCPAYDNASNTEFASLGSCIPGMSMRIMRDEEFIAEINEIGALQVSGPVVFSAYFNNQEATDAAFTKDGWFITGDIARLDSSGCLHIAGREKVTLVINGVNHSPQAIEATIEEANIPGTAPSFNVAFSYRPYGFPTETLCIVYLPQYAADDMKSRAETATSISRATVTYCGVRPFKVIPLEPHLLIKSSLGKLSRAKIRKAFEQGAYAAYEELDDKVIQQYRQNLQELPHTDTEITILDVFRELFNTSATDLGINSNIFDMGVSSVDMLTLKQHLQTRLSIEIPLTTCFTHPVVRDLAEALDKMQGIKGKEYEPVAILHSQGSKTPIWFIHPGMGECLIFMNLARYLNDRQVYALRARGFDGEPFFTSITEITQIYHQAIKRVQPKGPYAICGYSFGSILTFEVTKLLEEVGDEVKFVGTLDQPPHFKNYAYSMLSDLRNTSKGPVSKEDVLLLILKQAPVHRITELGLTKQRLETWADLAYNLKVISSNYDPSGTVKTMDIFYVEPLPIVTATNVDEWFDGYISKWEDFVEMPNFHFVEGGHRTLICPPYVLGFQKLLKDILKKRGL